MTIHSLGPCELLERRSRRSEQVLAARGDDPRLMALCRQRCGGVRVCWVIGPQFGIPLRAVIVLLFPGLLVDYVSEGPQIGVRVAQVVLGDPGLRTPPDGDKDTADGLADALRAMPDPAVGSWFVVSVEQSMKRIDLVGDGRDPLDGATCWRLIRSLRPGPVTVRLATRPPDSDDGSNAVPRQTYELPGWRRRYTDPHTGVIDSAYRPGELTQSLCSPWTHDFRDCSCTYWASNHPDIVAPAIPLGELTQPGGRPANPRYDTAIEWLRNPDYYPQMHAEALPSQQANRPFEASYYQINHQWQDFAIVLEGRESDGLYIPRSQLRDEAIPFSSAQELRERIVELAGLEHLVALLYLYGLFSVITSEDAARIATDGDWPTLVEDVRFVRSMLTEVAIGEMQHLRAVNLLLWNLDKRSGETSRPAVVPPARVLPQPGGKEPLPAKLSPLTLDTVQLFINIERSSAFIDGQNMRRSPPRSGSPVIPQGFSSWRPRSPRKGRSISSNSAISAGPWRAIPPATRCTCGR